MTDSAVYFGDNRPPQEYDPLRERLQEDYDAAITRTKDLLDAVGRTPLEVNDDEMAGKISDFIKQLTGHRKSLDSMRVSEKEPYLAGGRAVDGFFKPMMDKLDGGKKMIEQRITIYLRKKEAEERRRREAEEAHRREEEAKRRAEEERLRAEAEAAAKKVLDEADLDKAIEAEAEAKRASEAADQAEADRLEAERAAQAKAAELSRNRGDLGSVSSLRTFWDFEVTNYDRIDLTVIAPYIARADLDKAIRAYVKAGGRVAGKGVRIFENTSAVVR